MKAFDLAMHNGVMGCAICGKPLRLAAAKNDDAGLPVHEECCLRRLNQKQAPMPPAQKSTTLAPVR